MVVGEEMLGTRAAVYIRQPPLEMRVELESRLERRLAVARTTMAEIAKIRKTEEKKKATVVIDQYEAESLTYALMS